MGKKKQKKTETITTKQEAEKKDQSIFPVFHWPMETGAFEPFNTLRQEIDELFSQFANRFGLPHTGAEDSQFPALDVDETDQAIKITIEMPGVEEKDIDISLSNNLLTILGAKEKTSESEDASHQFSERRYSRYERSLRLPFNCDADDVSAEYSNGVLSLTIPKPELRDEKSQKITLGKAA